MTMTERIELMATKAEKARWRRSARACGFDHLSSWFRFLARQAAVWNGETPKRRNAKRGRKSKVEG
jgi:hypothetical protein